MRVLVLAPDSTSLPGIDEEVNAINATHEATVLNGTVRESDISEAIRDNPPFEILWIIAHGSSEGIEISEGKVIGVAGIGQYLDASGATLCILNSCSSEDAARAIVVGSRASLVYSISNIPDVEAVRFGSLLAVELAKEGQEIQAAFAAARPRKGDYRLLMAGVALRSMDLSLSSKVEQLRESQAVNVQKLYELATDARSMSQAIDALRATLDKLRAIVDGNREMTESDRLMRTWLLILSGVALVNLFNTINGIMRFFGGGG